VREEKLTGEEKRIKNISN